MLLNAFFYIRLNLQLILTTQLNLQHGTLTHFGLPQLTLITVNPANISC